jgi:hypothetical protein
LQPHGLHQEGLMEYFIGNYSPKKITTFADIRWTPFHEDSVYEKMGFTFLGQSKPNYWYSKTSKFREHRYNYRKDILVRRGYDEALTEFQIMDSLGYNVIWDCGTFRYELILNKF